MQFARSEYSTVTAKTICLATICLISGLLAFPFPGRASPETDAATAIAQAEATLASAYQAVLDAETAGGVIADLVEPLNAAGEHLAQAKMLSTRGRFVDAVTSAQTAQVQADVVRLLAEAETYSAYGSRITTLLIHVTVSLVAVIAVILGTHFAWRSFRNRYLQQNGIPNQTGMRK